MTTLQLIRNYAIIFIYVVLFGTAAYDKGYSTVQIATLSFNVKKFIFTISEREEDSQRPRYDKEAKMLRYQNKKRDNFQAIQYIAHKNITLGVLRNYYMLNETSVMATVLF